MAKFVCERTGKAIPMIEGLFVASTESGDWSFISADSYKDNGEYGVRINELIESAEELCDWLAHLNDKPWFDYQKFFNFFSRFC